MLVLGVPVLLRYDLLVEMLDSVRAGTMEPDAYVIVDNGGRLDPEHLSRRYPENARVIQVMQGDKVKNLGVAASWNAVLREFPQADVILTNDDLRLSPTGVAELAGAEGDIVLGAPVNDDADVPYGGGFELFLIRPSAVAAIGYFDERFWPAYFEDNDYARRAEFAGLKIGTGKALAYHHLSATVNALTDMTRDHMHALFDRNRDYYTKKWGGAPGYEKYETPFGRGS